MANKDAAGVLQDHRGQFDPTRLEPDGQDQTDVHARRIQFRLRVDGRNGPMPDHITATEPPLAPVLRSATGEPPTSSLSAPVLRNGLNRDERGVAVHLDGDAAVKWWHQNVAKTNHDLQGWKRGRIYPDFICRTGGGTGAGRIVVPETKGDHLQNPDTDDKTAVLRFLSDRFSWDHAVPAGQLQIAMIGEMVERALVLMEDIPIMLPLRISGARA